MPPFLRKFLVAAVFWTLAFGVINSTQAQSVPGRAEVRAVKGQAVYTVGNGPMIPVKVGNILPPGTVLRTGPESLVDLFLGRSAGTLRVAANSVLSLDRLTLTDTGLDTVVEVQLNLSEGQILGNVNKLNAASKYEIKVPNGVAGIRGTRFSCMSGGDIVLVDGTLIFVHVQPGGNPVPFTLTPGTMFSPAAGVQPAPPEVLQQVIGQMPGMPQRGQAQAPQQPKSIEPYVSTTTR